MWRGMCRAWRIIPRLLGAAAVVSLRVGAIADFSPAAGAFCDAIGAVGVAAGACTVAGGLVDGTVGVGVVVGACAQTGAAIRAANATPLNRRFIVSASETLSGRP